ncbi:MAG TPA: DUF202 domain-containing protein [Thermodesulfovibrionales bacterium]|nr:DUF202 domain-containing protein [Thermodesulfovibrionales bacterium]
MKTEQAEEQSSHKVRNRRVHMANERTFLAWIRTSIAIMAFGFVVEKFGLFLRQISSYLMLTDGLHRGVAEKTSGFSQSYSAVLGVVLVGFGAIMGLLAFIRYKKVERQIDNDTFQPSVILDLLLMISLLAVAVFLVLYLIHSV